MDVQGVLLILEGDDGQRGSALAWTAELPVRAVVAAIEEAATPLLVGADPLDRPRILASLWRAFRVGLPLPVIGIVDVALWDFVARSEDLSIADMLGRRRDRIRGCASAPPVETAQDCEAMVNELLDAGFRAIKLHVCGDLDTDIAVCRAARRAGGDDVDLMMDAMGLYDRHGARSAWLRTRRTRLPLVRGSALGRGPEWLEGAEAPARDPHRGGGLGTFHRARLRPIGDIRGVRHRAHGCGTKRHHRAACARRPRRVARTRVRGPQLRLRPRTGRQPAGRPVHRERRLLRAAGPRLAGSTSASGRVWSSTRTDSYARPPAPASGSNSTGTLSRPAASTSTDGGRAPGVGCEPPAGLAQARSPKVSAAATVKDGTWELSPIRQA